MLKRFLAVTLLVALFVGTGSAFSSWWRKALLQPIGVGPVTIEVSRGSAVSTVLEQLDRAGLLGSARAGRLYYELEGNDRAFHWGIYRFSPTERPVDVIEAILSGRVDTFSLTVVEGMAADEILEVLEDRGVPGTERWAEIINEVAWVADISPNAASLEGFLFPDTYTFAVGASAGDVARHMTERFRQVWAEVAAGGLALEVLDTVTLASLVEAETSVPEERPRVAGVFLNRLQRGMLLQCDPTVVFALKRQGAWTGRLLRVHWQFDDPYNTYRYPGLPPGPINSPGKASLAAAASPELHNLLYFVAKPDGGHAFSQSLKEHNRHVARLYRFRR